MASRPWLTREIVRGVALVAAALVAGGALAYVASGVVSPRYEARAEVAYRLDADLGAGFLRQDRRLSTQIVAMTGHATLARVAKDIGVPVEDVEKAASAAVVGDSEVLRVSAVDTDPERALRIVTQIRMIYLADTNQSGDTGELARLDAELAELGRTEAEVAARVAVLAPASDAAGPLRTELTAVRARVDVVKDRIRAVERDALARQPATALADPYVLADPVSPRRPLMAVGGALAAALVAAAALVVWRQVTLRHGGRS